MSSTMGEKIRELRRRLKMTQAELAGDDFTKSFISQIEKGQTRPSLRSLQVIAKRLGRPVSYFLAEEEVPSKSPNLASTLAVARTHLSNNRVKDSLIAFRKALLSCPPNDYATKGEIHVAIGRLEFMNSAYADALTEFTLAVEVLEQSYLSELYVKCLSDQGSAHYQLFDYSNARRAFQNALESYKRLAIQNAHLLLTVQSNLGNTLSRLHDYKAAIHILESALTTSTSSGDYYLFGKLNHILGYCYETIGMYTKAITATSRAIDFYTLVGNTQLELQSQLNLASHLRKQGELIRAQETISNALIKPSTNQYSFELAHAHAELALIHLDEGNAQAAVDQVKTALHISPIHENLPQWAGIIAKCSSKMSINEEIIAQLERAAEEWTGDPTGLAELHSHLGDMYTQLENPNRANYHLSRSVTLYRQLRNT